MRILAFLAILAMTPALAAEPAKTAVFDIELIDMSQEAERGIREDQTRRLAMASDELRKLLQASPQLRLVDIAPQRKAIDDKAPLNKCNGCDEDLGKALGADLVVSGIREDQTRRLAMVSEELRKLLQASPQLRLVDIAPQRKAIDDKAPLNKCNGCDEDLGKALGADLVVSGIIQKTSNLILSFAITVKDVHSGKVIRAGQVDIRGNNDDSWLRGVRWVVKNRLLAEPLPIPS